MTTLELTSGSGFNFQLCHHFRIVVMHLPKKYGALHIYFVFNTDILAYLFRCHCMATIVDQSTSLPLATAVALFYLLT